LTTKFPIRQSLRESQLRFNRKKGAKMIDDPLSSMLSTLSERGIRLTRQRRIVAEILASASSHLNAEELLRLARERDSAIDRATVYRSLSLLKEQGLIDELDLLHLEGGEHFYERRKPKGHVHIGCYSCGRILELETSLIQSLEAEIRRKTGFLPDSIRVEAHALCPACQKRCE
jgi:Fur family ferric uptake transcriptional regulator